MIFLFFSSFYYICFNQQHCNHFFFYFLPWLFSMFFGCLFCLRLILLSHLLYFFLLVLLHWNPVEDATELEKKKNNLSIETFSDVAKREKRKRNKWRFPKTLCQRLVQIVASPFIYAFTIYNWFACISYFFPFHIQQSTILYSLEN